MTHYTLGDLPPALLIEPASVTVPFNGSEAEFVLENGTAQFAPSTVAEGLVSVTLPLLGQVGRHEVRVVLVAPGVRLSLPPVPVIVEHEDGGGWLTIDAARSGWQGAPDDDAALYDLLHSAREQVLAYAPALADNASVPTRYRQAQLMQARNSWNGYLRNPSGEQFGSPEFSTPTFPLDWHVRQLLRPTRAVPVVA